MVEGNAVNKIICNFCGGRGRVGEDGFDGDDIACPVCQGECAVLVDAGAAPHSVCDGTGRIKLRGGPFGKQVVPCPDCKGTGWFV